MFVYLLSKVVTNVLGLLYPAYLSFVAVKNKDVRGYVQWMMYWIVFAFYSFCESFTDTFIGPWFPFYYELKILLVIWLMSPVTRGANIVYRRFIHPNLVKYEPEIDLQIAGVKDKVGSVFYRWASKLVGSVTEVLTETLWSTAVRVRENDFMRRAMSLNSLEHDQLDTRVTRSADNSPTEDGGMELDNYISERMKRDMFLQRSMPVQDPDLNREYEERMLGRYQDEDEDFDADGDNSHTTAIINAPRTRSRKRKEQGTTAANTYGALPRTRKPRKQRID